MQPKATCKDCGTPLPPEAPEGLCPKCLMKVALGSQAPGTQPCNLPAKDSEIPLPDPATLAKLFPQLEILELLGQGGMGAVYKARQPTLDRLVALKILPARAAGDSGFAERFNREARALAKLNHPNIVAVHDFGQANGLNYLTMEYVDGPNLRRLEETGKLNPRQALQIIPQICEALQFAHDEGVVHRDIKPENILLDKKGRVKIADFGLAKILNREPKDWRLTGAKDVMGTPHYMAPEQVEHPQQVDHRADIYSLGVVFYEMLTGELPLGKFAPPSQKVQVDVRLDEVVLHALEKEPARRYQMASQVKTDVQSIATTPGHPSIASSQTKTPAPSNVWKLAAVGSVAIILLLAFLVFLPRVNSAPEFLVTGIVTDSATGKPVPGARVADHLYGVTARHKAQEAWTDVTGRYALKTWSEEHTVAASAPGFEPSLTTLAFHGGDHTTVRDFTLHRTVEGLDGVQPSIPPVVVKTIPESGATGVDPSLTELQVTFSKVMQDQNWSWCTIGEESFPQKTGEIHYLPDHRTCVMPVKLQPRKLYAIWINSERADNFQDTSGLPALPYLLIFETKNVGK